MLSIFSGTLCLVLAYFICTYKNRCVTMKIIKNRKKRTIVKKFIYAITPFCIYSFFVLLFYYVADYLAPTHNMELAGYLFALFYLFHFLIGIFVLGFIFGKITQKRFASKKLIHSLWLAVFTFVVIFIIGGLDGIFSQMQFRSHQTTIDDFIFGISHPDTHYFAIGTFCSFFLGELHEYFILKKKQKEEDGIK